jgi:hypothetical protein
VRGTNKPPNHTSQHQIQFPSVILNSKGLKIDADRPREHLSGFDIELPQMQRAFDDTFHDETIFKTLLLVRAVAVRDKNSPPRLYIAKGRRRGRSAGRYHRRYLHRDK